MFRTKDEAFARMKCGLLIAVGFLNVLVDGISLALRIISEDTFYPIACLAMLFIMLGGIGHMWLDRAAEKAEQAQKNEGQAGEFVEIREGES